MTRNRTFATLGDGRWCRESCHDHEENRKQPGKSFHKEISSKRSRQKILDRRLFAARCATVGIVRLRRVEFGEVPGSTRRALIQLLETTPPRTPGAIRLL